MEDIPETNNHPSAAERYRTLLEINNAIISNLTEDSLFRAISESQPLEECVVLPFEASSIVRDQGHSPHALQIGDDDLHNSFGLELRRQKPRLLVGPQAGGH